MARNFTITTPSETVRIGPDGRGEMTFTVTNVSGFPTRGLGRIVPMGTTNAEWLSLTEVEREFPAGGVHQFRVGANIPPGTPAGRYLWRFDVVSAVKSGEGIDLGPTVAFEIGATEAPKNKVPWWLWLAIAIGVLVLAVVAFLMFRKKDPPPPPPPPPEVVKVKVPDLMGDEFGSAILQLQNAGLGVVMKPRFVRADPRIRLRGINTVVDQSPAADVEVEKGTPVTIFVLRIRGSRLEVDDLKGKQLSREALQEVERFRRNTEQSQ